MRMLLFVTIPHEPFNTLVREGKIGSTMNRILEDCAPESVYFTEKDGTRGAVLVVDVDQPAKIPALAEPWFLNFRADCEFRIAMTPDDLSKAGLDQLGKKWR